jgi:photosystem II stability/assembly factor-like uncharacterized protein
MKRASLLLALAVLSVFACGMADSNPDVQFERIGPFGGTVRSLLQSPSNPKRLYLGTSNGHIFKSVDGGATWDLLHPGIGKPQYVIDTLVQHPSDPERLYAGAWDLRSSGGGLFESRDGGATWRPLPLPESSPAIRDFAICRTKPRYMLVGTLVGAYFSQDGGATWKHAGRKDQIRNVASVAIDPVDPRYMFVGTFRLAYRSSDQGKSWVRVNQGMLYDSHVFSLAIDERDSNIVFASACSGVYRSANRGLSWKRLKVLPDRFGVRAHVVRLDPADRRRVYAGTTEGLFVSANNGQTWRRITPARLTVNAIRINPDGNESILLATENRGVLQSSDGGKTWAESNSGFVHRQVSRVLPDPELKGGLLTGIVADGRKGAFYLFNGQGEWTILTNEVPGNRDVLSFLTLPGNRGRLAGTTQGIYCQDAPEKPWRKLPGLTEKLAVRDLRADFAGNWIIAATERGIFRSRPDPLQFDIPEGSPTTASVSAFAVAADGLWYAGGRQGVLRSADQGSTWRNISNGIPAGVSVDGLALCPAEDGHMFAGTVAGLFETTDGGAAWRKARDGRLSAAVPSIIFLDKAGKKLMAADHTFGGVFLSSDGGASWNKISSPRFASPVRALAQDPARPLDIYLGTVSDGVYRLRLGSGL